MKAARSVRRVVQNQIPTAIIAELWSKNRFPGSFYRLKSLIAQGRSGQLHSMNSLVWFFKGEIFQFWSNWTRSNFENKARKEFSKSSDSAYPQSDRPQVRSNTQLSANRPKLAHRKSPSRTSIAYTSTNDLTKNSFQ